MDQIVERRVDGRIVHYSPREGADLVVPVRLAGAGGGVWDALWPLLAERHAIASVELGRPDTDREPRAVFEDFAGVVLGATRRLGHGRVHLVGWNGGAHIALAAALKRPPALASVTLMTPFRETGEMRQIEIGLDLLDLLLRTGQRELYAYYWFMAGFSDRFIEERFDVVEALAHKRLANDGFLALDVDRAMAWMRALRRDHASDGELAAIDRPVLVLAAGQNRWHAGPTKAMAERIAGLIPGSELAVFEGCGSFFPIEEAERTAQLVLSFIDRRTTALPPSVPAADYQ